MTVEAEILLACARASLTPEQKARLSELFAQPVDWPRLVDLAEWHGLLPLVSHHTAHVGSGSEADAELRARARSIVGRNLMMTATLGHVVRRLESRDIPALPYKGPLLAVAAYGSLGLRPFDDLDLLIPARHVREAVRLLQEDGYQPLYRLTAGQERAYLRSQCEYILERGHVRVELHWAIVPRYFAVSLDLDRLWARSTPTVVAGATFRTLCPEDLLLVLCVHGSKHCWDRLEWVASFAEIVRRHPAMDWDDVRETARRAGARRLLDVSLALARDLIGVELPVTARDAIDAGPEVRVLAGEIGRRLLSGNPGTLDRPAEVRFHLRARERLRDRLRYTVRLATTQTLGDWDLVGLPRGADTLYRVIRPLRLLGKFGPPAIGRSLRALRGGSGVDDHRAG